MLDPNHLIELANYRMPFGKYKGYYLSNSANKESVIIMRMLKDMNYLDRKYDYIEGGEEGCLKMDEIKVNGLEKLVEKLIKK